MGFQKYKDLEFIYEYDFAVDGGAVSEINLRPIGNAISTGLVIEDFTVFVEESFTSAGDGASAAFGTNADPDGFLEATVQAGFQENSVAYPGAVAGDDVWDDTNDHKIKYHIVNANQAVPSITISGEALTGGKAKCVIKCKRF